MRRALILLATMASAGCVSTPRRAAPDPELLAVIARAAAQVRPCYRAPRVGSAGRQIVTVLRVSYAPDGSLSALPDVVEQRGLTEANRADAPKMAEAAGLAVLRCAPLHLPPERYRGGWDSFELTFSPKGVA